MQQLQLIDGDGVFNAAGLDNFVKKGKLAERGLSYVVVAIMGPQSSGKSTLMNHLFHTKFKEMNAPEGWSQTTQGIWLAESVGIEPFTIVMDLEGNDGKERGEDIGFEKRAALFALAVSDILLINMKCSDVGRLNAGNRPLLRSIFEVVLQSLGPRRRTTLMFILRDYFESTPLDKLEKSLRVDIQKIWDEVQTSAKYKHTRLLDTYRVEVIGLPDYNCRRIEFVNEVAKLRERFQNSNHSKGLASDGRETVVPASEFSFSSQKIWEVIKQNKNLDLPAHRIMISNARCEAIADNIVDKLRKNKIWLDLKRDVQIAPVQGFGEKLRSIITICLLEYDVEVQYLDEKVRKTKRTEVLERNASVEFYPAYETMLGHLHHEALESFKVKLDQSNKSKQEPDCSKRNDKFFESVYTFAGAAILDFDRRSLECLVAIEKHEQTQISNFMTVLKDFNPEQTNATMISNVITLLKGFNPFNKRSTSDGINMNRKFPIFSILKDIIPFYRHSSGNYYNWNPSKTRDLLRTEMENHAIQLFMELWMDPSTNKEEGKMVYKKKWEEWLCRVLGMIVDWFN